MNPTSQPSRAPSSVERAPIPRRLHLDEVMRVLPYWPRERFIELAPNRWRATRDALDPKEVALPIGPITVPAKTSLATA